MNQLLAQFPQINRQIWMQRVGRSLFRGGHGLISFYAPIVFVDRVGLSATSVGLGIGLASLVKVGGFFLAGAMTDSPQWGRKQTLIYAAALSAIGAFVLTLTSSLPVFVIAYVLLDLGTSLYWPATDAAIADLTPLNQRQQTFALLGVFDSLGLGVGVLAGALFVAAVHASSMLFGIGGLLFVIMAILIQFGVNETHESSISTAPALSGWKTAIQDSSLLIFMAVNLLFTVYIALVNNTLPLYFTNFVGGLANNTTQIEFASANVSILFIWQVAIGALLQVPLVQMLTSVGGIRALMISLGLWELGFFLVGVSGIVTTMQWISATMAFTVLAIATVIYRPFAAAIVADLSPQSLRGIYAAINAQCWAVGGFIGPALGGWALDQSESIVHWFWAIAALSPLIGLLILRMLQNRMSVDSTEENSVEVSASSQ